MKFFCRINQEGTGLDFGDGTDRFKAFAKKNRGAKMAIEDYLPESKNQRAYFEGAVIPLFAYLDGHDYRDWSVIKYLRDNYIKPEFNGEAVIVNGRSIKVGKTTKRPNLQPLIDKFIDWMEEQYGIDRTECLNPEDYKHFVNTIFSYSDYDTYIDYLVDLKKLPIVYLGKPYIRPQND